MKQFLVSVLLFALVGLPLFGQAKVAIFDYDDRLDQPDTLAKQIEGLIKVQIPGTVVEQFSGKADERTATAVAKKIEASGYSLVILITSDAVIIARHFLLKTPTLFANANNPLGLGFTSDKAPGGNLSGASYYVAVERKLDLFRKVLPGMKKIGVVFDDSDKARDIELAETKKACQTLGLALEVALIKEKSEFKGAVTGLMAKGVDSIALATSGLLYDNVSEIFATCAEKKVPLFSYHTKGATNGAVAAYGTDYLVLAEKKLMPMVKAVLGGKSPGSLDIQFPDTPDLYLNLKSANAFGLTLSADLIASAKKIIK